MRQHLPRSQTSHPAGEAFATLKLAPDAADNDAGLPLDHHAASVHRLALMGTLTAMIAHEFNNLMTPVVAFATEALRHDDPQFTRRALDRALSQGQRAVELSKRLLALSGRSDTAVCECSLRALVDEAIAAAARPFEKDSIELNVDVPADLCIRADRILFEQLLLNLLLNARNALKEHRGRICIAARPGGDHVIIDVSDTGSGLDREDVVTRINPFLGASGDGDPADWQEVGLGLNICRMIAHAHAAAIHAIPQEHGFTVRLTWPKA